jgi:hypothetical protein
MSQKHHPLLPHILDLLSQSTLTFAKHAVSGEPLCLDEDPFGDHAVAEAVEHDVRADQGATRGASAESRQGLAALPYLPVVDRGYALRDLWLYLDGGRLVLGLSTDDVARILRVHVNALHSWRWGDTLPNEDERRRLIAFAVFAELIRERVFPSPTAMSAAAAQARAWFDAPVAALGVVSPRAALDGGYLRTVNYYLLASARP